MRNKTDKKGKVLHSTVGGKLLRRPVIPGMLLCFFFLFQFLPTVDGSDITIDVYIPAVFRYDEDGKCLHALIN